MDLLDVIPLLIRTEQDIREGMDEAVNQGKDPDDPTWVDTREGSPFHVITQPAVIEFARLYDLVGNELVAASSVETAWGDYLDLHAAAYGLERKAATAAEGVVTFMGDNGTLIPTNVELSTEQVDPDVEPPTFVTTQSGSIPIGGEIDLAIVASETGTAGNVPASSVVFVTLNGVSAVVNDLAIVGGTDEESDEALRERIKLRFAVKGAGTQTDYKRIVLDVEGVGRVEVIPHHDGPGTVMVVISDANGQPLSAGKVAEVQQLLDPVPGQGAGLAPIDHEVTVATPTVVPIDVSAEIHYAVGYSLDGDNGTVPTRAALVAALASYVNKLPSGGDVVYENAKAMFFDVKGVVDVDNVLIEGSGTNVAIAATPPQVAQLGTTTFTEVLA